MNDTNWTNSGCSTSGVVCMSDGSVTYSTTSTYGEEFTCTGYNYLYDLDYWITRDIVNSINSIHRLMSRIFKPVTRKAIVNTKRFLFIRRFNRR